MNPVMPGHFAPMGPPPWALNLPPFPPPSSAFWNAGNICERLKDLNDSVNLAKAMEKELELLIKRKNEKGAGESDDSFSMLSEFMEKNKVDLESLERLALEAANALTSKLRSQLEPFRLVVDEKTPWEEKSALKRLADKVQKYKRNKLWRKRKRKRLAEKLAKEREQFEQIDKAADEWRANEIAKDIAKQKVEKLKQVAKVKAKEEKKRLESELELILMVEKLQELRSIRIQKLKKQGHFLPEEDDKFLERVRAAVEEEERQIMAAADSEVAKGAIATAEESRRNVQHHGAGIEEKSSSKENEDQIVEDGDKHISNAVIDEEPKKGGQQGPISSSVYDSVVNLPAEFYHYYYGSNTDMGTLIERLRELFFRSLGLRMPAKKNRKKKLGLGRRGYGYKDAWMVILKMIIIGQRVRRTWDAYIRPGGSRIPSHWVQPPPPSDDVWASYLVKPR